MSSCRIHLTTCLDSEYGAQHGSGDHTDEISNPPPVGLLEVGIIGARGLPPIKRKNGRLSSHPYCVARYGRKWVRTRTIINSRDPLFQEQYSWDVYDTATVLIVGVFDNAQVEESSSGGYKGVSLGKIRIHLSEIGRAHV